MTTPAGNLDETTRFPTELRLARLAAAAYNGPAALPPGIEVRLDAAVNHVQFTIFEDAANCYLVYAGTNQTADWLRHVKFYRTRLPHTLRQPHPVDRGDATLRNLCAAARFHRAWQTDAESTLRLVTRELAGAYRLHNKRLWFLGHSYGAPLAAWMAYHFAVKWPGCARSYRSYGGPNPGNMAMRRAFAALVPDAIAYRNPGDVVTKVPFSGQPLGQIVSLPFTFPAHGMRRYLRAISKRPPYPTQT